MRTRVLVLIIIGVLAAAGMAIFFSGKNEAVNMESSDAVGNVATELFEVPLLSSQQTRDVFPERNLSVSLDVPRVSLLKHPELAQAANAVIDAFVAEIIREMTGATTEAAESRGEEPPSDFVLGWTPLIVSPTIISIRFDYSFYFPGAAHPDNRTRVLNYDIERHLVLTTTDLFASSTLALPFLSAYARRTLPERLGESSVEKSLEFAAGTDATIENFREVGIVSTGFLVIFNPSQVAAYARGTITLPIPLAELETFVAPEIKEAIRQSSENFREAVPIE